MDNFFIPMALGALLGLGSVGLFQVAKVHKVLTEIRDSLQQDKLEID